MVDRGLLSKNPKDRPSIDDVVGLEFIRVRIHPLHHHSTTTARIGPVVRVKSRPTSGIPTSSPSFNTGTSHFTGTVDQLQTPSTAGSTSSSPMSGNNSKGNSGHFSHQPLSHEAPTESADHKIVLHGANELMQPPTTSSRTDDSLAEATTDETTRLIMLRRDVKSDSNLALDIDGTRRPKIVTGTKMRRTEGNISSTTAGNDTSSHVHQLPATSSAPCSLPFTIPSPDVGESKNSKFLFGPCSAHLGLIAC